MADYIEREAALAAIRERCAPCGEGIEALKSVPAADVAPVVMTREQAERAAAWFESLMPPTPGARKMYQMAVEALRMVARLAERMNRA